MEFTVRLFELVDTDILRMDSGRQALLVDWDAGKTQTEIRRHVQQNVQPKYNGYSTTGVS